MSKQWRKERVEFIEVNMMKKYLLSRLVVVLLLIGTATVTAFSQENGGSILGTVTDQATASIAGAAIRITDIDTGVSTSTLSNTTGSYAVSFLPQGNYRVEVTAKGFAHTVIPSVKLHVGDTLHLNFIIQVGKTQQTIAVTAETPMLQSASTSTGQTIESVSVKALPQLNLNTDSLALLGTGMQRSQNVISNVIANAATGGVTVTANGIRDSANQYTIDTANVNIGMYNYPAFVPISYTVQDVTVLAGNYSAEYGQYAGAHVNDTLKSGTNSFHGEAFEYLQNTAMNARNYFSPTVPTLRQNQFGGVLGGPIRRNKTFFMASYEGLRNFSNTYIQSVVLTAAQRNGNLSQSTGGSPVPPFNDPETGRPFPGNQIPSSRISPQAKAASLYDPLPNQSGAVNYATFVNEPQTSNATLIKIDNSFGSRDQLSGTYLNHNFTMTPLTGYAVPFAYFNLPITFNNIALIETHTFSPTAVLSTTVSWNLDHVDQLFPQNSSSLNTRQIFDMVIPSSIAPGNPVNAYPSFLIPGYTPIGEPGNNPLYQPDSNYQIASNMAVTKGKHILTFGFEMDRFRSSRLVNDNTNGVLSYQPTNPAGTGNAVADFLLGLPNNTGLGLLPIQVDLRRTAVDMYMADKWLVTQKLVIDAGIRYELNTPTNEHNGRISLFNFTAPGSFQTLAPGEGLWHGGLADFAPRLGLAYLFTKKDVIRTSGGIYYSTTPQLIYTFDAANPPFNTTYNFFASASAPLSSSNPFPLNQAAAGGVPSPMAIQNYQHAPAVYEWMLDFQHSFSPSTILDVGYVGNRGVHFGRDVALNIPLVPGPGPIQARRPLPNFGPVTKFQLDSFSTYESLQARLEKRFSHGLSFLASYTWSKNLDLWSNELGVDTVIPTNLNFDYGPSDFDVPQNFTLSYVYDLPFGIGRRFLNGAGIMDKILGGWELGGITTLRSGMPFTVTYPGDVANVGLGTRPVRICNGALKHPTIHDWFDLSCFVKPAQYTFGNSKRGILFGPGYKDWDVSLEKTFPTFKGQSFQLGGDFFNIFNNANFGQPNATIATPGEGEITSAGPSRFIQVSGVYEF